MQDVVYIYEDQLVIKNEELYVGQTKLIYPGFGNPSLSSVIASIFGKTLTTASSAVFARKGVRSYAYAPAHV